MGYCFGMLFNLFGTLPFSVPPQPRQKPRRLRFMWHVCLSSVCWESWCVLICTLISYNQGRGVNRIFVPTTKLYSRRVRSLDWHDCFWSVLRRLVTPKCRKKEQRLDRISLDPTRDIAALHYEGDVEYLHHKITKFLD